MYIEPNSLILFQGDSITDAGRDRANSADLGYGYANFIAAWLSAAHPQSNLRFLNRGISGNRAIDLEARWQADCVDLQPDWVSILIGINDTWRRYDSGQATTTESYEQSFRVILERTTNETKVRLILLEPFVLPIPDDRAAWREDLDPKIAVARRLAREFGALYVPLDGLFAAASTLRSMESWAYDGVHPTHAGHALIAQHWMRTIKAL